MMRIHMVEETPADAEGDGKEEEAASSSSGLQVKRLLMLVAGMAVLLLVVGGVIAYLMWPRSTPKEPVEQQAAAERIGPRSIMEGISKLQNQHKGKTGRFSNSIQELWDAYKAEPKGLSEALAETLEEAIGETNLVVRTIPNGYEIALRQDRVRWLVFSQAGAGAPKVTTQETEGAPPFGVAGVSRSAVEVKVQELVEFKDPLRFFAVMLPGGFEMDDGSKGQTARITFSYDSGVRMTVKAMEVSREWDPANELAAKAEQIESRLVPAFSEFDLAVKNLLDVEGATGYEMGLTGKESKTGMQTHSFVFGGERTTLSIALICSGPEGAPLYDALVNAVRNTLRAEEGPSAAARRVARKPGMREEAEEKKAEEPQRAALTPEQEAQWNEARGLLRTTGIMRSGDAYVALVNDRLLHVNETITVAIKGNLFKFSVKSITVDQVEFEPVLTETGGDQERVLM